MFISEEENPAAPSKRLFFEKIFELETIDENLENTLGTCKVVKSVSLDSYEQTVHGLQTHKAFFFGVDKKKALVFRNIDVTDIL